jgi:hypothetical protein
MANVGFCAFTSRVAMGISCQVPWDKVVVDMSELRGCSVQNLFQMIGRFRVLKQAKVLFLVHAEFAHNTGRMADAYDQAISDLYTKQKKHTEVP